eukprot:9488067-Pyramimonas_sp.AAC.1
MLLGLPRQNSPMRPCVGSFEDRPKFPTNCDDGVRLDYITYAAKRMLIYRAPQRRVVGALNAILHECEALL